MSQVECANHLSDVPAQPRRRRWRVWMGVALVLFGLWLVVMYGFFTYWTDRELHEAIAETGKTHLILSHNEVVHCAETDEQAYAEAKDSVLWYLRKAAKVWGGYDPMTNQVIGTPNTPVDNPSTSAAPTIPRLSEPWTN